MTSSYCATCSGVSGFRPTPPTCAELRRSVRFRLRCASFRSAHLCSNLLSMTHDCGAGARRRSVSGGAVRKDTSSGRVTATGGARTAATNTKPTTPAPAYMVTVGSGSKKCTAATGPHSRISATKIRSSLQQRTDLGYSRVTTKGDGDERSAAEVVTCGAQNQHKTKKKHTHPDRPKLPRGLRGSPRGRLSSAVLCRKLSQPCGACGECGPAQDTWGRAHAFTRAAHPDPTVPSRKGSRSKRNDGARCTYWHSMAAHGWKTAPKGWRREPRCGTAASGPRTRHRRGAAMTGNAGGRTAVSARRGQVPPRPGLGACACEQGFGVRTVASLHADKSHAAR